MCQCCYKICIYFVICVCACAWVCDYLATYLDATLLFTVAHDFCCARCSLYTMIMNHVKLKVTTNLNTLQFYTLVNFILLLHILLLISFV